MRPDPALADPPQPTTRLPLLARQRSHRILALLILLGCAALTETAASAEVRLSSQRPGRPCPVPNAGFAETSRVRVCFLTLADPGTATRGSGAMPAAGVPAASGPELDPNAYSSNYKRSASQAASGSGSTGGN